MSTVIDAMSDTVAAAVDVLRGRRAVVLTGAGVSTDSGIPDYRGPSSPRHTPMTIAEFRSGAAARQRYWARSHVGWERIRQARPNGSHHALAALQAAGIVSVIITQNVDGLHQAAGAGPVIDLHGRLDAVVCLNCGARSSRIELQHRLSGLNPGFSDDEQGGAGPSQATVRPDGDADVGDTSAFVIAACVRCGGILKPDVVFFGENVPQTKVRAAYEAVASADAMLVAGSSLTVMSGLRFVKRAAAQGKPVVIVNQGSTRGDPLAEVKIGGGCATVLEALTRALT